MATWDRLPIGRPIATLAPDKDWCPWCPDTEHNTLHLFQQCYIAKHIWDLAHMIFAASTHSHPPPTLPNPSLNTGEHRLLRSIQSAALSALWNAFTNRAFGLNAIPTHLEITYQFFRRLLTLRSTDLQLEPNTPWLTAEKIQSLIHYPLFTVMYVPMDFYSPLPHVIRNDKNSLN